MVQQIGLATVIADPLRQNGGRNPERNCDFSTPVGTNSGDISTYSSGYFHSCRFMVPCRPHLSKREQL
jgi:hypothetical protein